MTVGLGPAKGKDFATSIGPWLVTPDGPIEDGRLQLTATASLGDREITRSDAGAMHWSWPQLLAHARARPACAPATSSAPAR